MTRVTTARWSFNDYRHALRQSDIASHFAGSSTCVLLGALAAFIAVLISRLNRIIDRTIVLNAISDNDAVKFRLKAA